MRVVGYKIADRSDKGFFEEREAVCLTRNQVMLHEEKSVL